MKKVVVVLIALTVMSSMAATTYDTNYVSGLQKSFFVTDGGQSTISVTGGIAFDPSSQTGGVYDRVYLANRTTSNTKRGLYSVDVINETSSSRLALAGDGSNDLDSPNDVTVDSLGTAYVSYDLAPSVWKVTDPSGSPVELQMLGNYGASGDDDPKGLAMVPAGFSGGFVSDSDVVVSDIGLDFNEKDAISILGAASTLSNNVVTTIWEDSQALRGTSSDFDGRVYFVYTDLQKDDSGTAYINRLNSAGGVERILLDIDPDDVSRLDDAIVVNPDDGSVWISIQDINGVDSEVRNVYRVDVVSATATNGDFLAATTLEISDLGHNVGKNGMAFSPDGEQLAFVSPTDQDQMIIYDIALGSPYAGHQKTFFTTDTNQTDISTSGAIAFDPTSQNGGDYDRVYLLNRTSNVDKRGLYSIDVINETSSGLLALGGDTNSTALNEPAGLVVDTSGTAYVCYNNTPSVWKVTNPSGISAEIQMLGNYGAAGDDDPEGVALVPTGFGGGYTTGSDLVLFDSGLDLSLDKAISIIDQASTVGVPDVTTIWTDPNNNATLRLDSSEYDGYIYFARTTLETAELDGTTNAFVIRLDGNGVTSRIFLDIAAASVPGLDDAVAINPVDGSLWLNINDGDTRNVFRVDVANAVATNNDYLAETLLVIGDLGYNVGFNSMAFSPDGKQLAFGAPTGQDAMYVYDVIVTTSPYGEWVKGFGLSGVDAASTTDFDMDGLNNLYEFGLGGDPTNSADQGIAPSHAITEDGGTNWLTYIYPSRLDSELTYFLELNTDLVVGSWTNSGYEVQGVGSIDVEFDAVTNRVSTEIEDEQFVRLIIEE
jgi:sugar lactone lactonase YvrE